MKTLELEIKRLEEFYAIYKSVKTDPFWRDLILSWYEERLAKLYTEQSSRQSNRLNTEYDTPYPVVATTMEERPPPLKLATKIQSITPITSLR